MRKRLFKKQMKTIAITVMAMILVWIATVNLLENGLSGLFTIKAYKEAFTAEAFDVYMIKLIASCIEIFLTYACYIELQSNVEEEKDLILYERGELDG